MEPLIQKTLWIELERVGAPEVLASVHEDRRECASGAGGNKERGTIIAGAEEN